MTVKSAEKFFFIFIWLSIIFLFGFLILHGLNNIFGSYIMGVGLSVSAIATSVFLAIYEKKGGKSKNGTA
ncbi:hypothetical protein A2755_03990 [Candidatus Wolfebacteria bacterium RIFCSPHIGHO2_01_FULL_48_22]|uniref:Uncharacterized protein n=2 Tax=Candidatus Wolfeibacteriota TaxID=1752735 RepID=A0A1F8DNV9_9BACT|nr:MAG: hypothetical protein A2755_03990 [Candidatus Wolfebacteria bacterium RIFCSPHIGHO2_01_FULL_48_22]OGM93499.1 MAG: hypothetical protein A2935_01340 [Candidatus Wolfebacteria bacterium RIFCSPLOWO2_01_FULL_47_17b]